MKASATYLIKSFHSGNLLAKLKENHIEVISLKKQEEYLYILTIAYKDKKKILLLYPDAKLLKEEGILVSFLHFLKKKTTPICVILSLLFFFYLSTLLMKIEIIGTSKVMNENISTYLTNNNIRIYHQLPNKEDLDSLKNDFFFKNSSSLESLEFVRNGNILKIRYILRKKEVNLEENHGKMFAKKEGIIAKILIDSGFVLVKENQYVNIGTLLVDDHFYHEDQMTYVGTKGKIYAYTFSSVYVKCPSFSDEVTTFSYLLDLARQKVTSSFSEGDYIDKEIILNYSLKNEAYLNVSYTLYENIVTF